MENIKFQVSPYQDELQLLINGEKSGYMSVKIDDRVLIIYHAKLDENYEGKSFWTNW